MGLFLFGEAGAYYRKDFFIRGGGGGPIYRGGDIRKGVFSGAYDWREF